MPLLLTLTAQAGLLFSYNRLALKDLDQMNHLVLEKIKEAKGAGGNKTVPLKEALQAVFSRPNEDFLIEKVLPPLKNELEELGGWEHSVKALVKEALGALGNPKAFKPEAQVTYEVFLENLVSELKPKVSETFERSVIAQIRDAKIVLTKEAVSERKLRMMKDSISPSDLAQTVLAAYEEQAKAVPAAAAASAVPEKGADKMGEKSTQTK